MRSSLVVRASDCQCTNCNGPLSSIPTSVGTVESEGRQMKQCWIPYSTGTKDKKKKFLQCPPTNDGVYEHGDEAQLAEHLIVLRGQERFLAQIRRRQRALVLLIGRRRRRLEAAGGAARVHDGADMLLLLLLAEHRTLWPQRISIIWRRQSKKFCIFKVGTYTILTIKSGNSVTFSRLNLNFLLKTYRCGLFFPNESFIGSGHRCWQSLLGI